MINLSTYALYTAMIAALALILLGWRSVYLLRAKRTIGTRAWRIAVYSSISLLILATLTWLLQVLPEIATEPKPHSSSTSTPPPRPPAQSESPSPSSQPSPARADMYFAPTKGQRRPGTTLRYGTSSFINKSGNWTPGEYSAAQIRRISGLRSKISGCQDLRQVRYPGLGSGPKSLTFSAALTDDYLDAPMRIVGKVQHKKHPDDPWSTPRTFEIKFGKTGPYVFNAGRADEILVSIYPDPLDSDCADGSTHIVYFDASIHFR